MDTQSHRRVVERFLAAYNTFDIDGMVALLALSIRFENYTGDELTAATTGIEAFRQLAEQSRAMFSEREQRITSIDVQGATVNVDIAYRGRLAVDGPNGLTAGTLLELEGRSEYSFADGLIVKIVDRA